MKIQYNSCRIAVGLAAGVVSAWSWSAAAQDMDTHSGEYGNTRGIYLGVDVGASFLQNMVNRGQVTSFVSPGQVAEFNVGSRFNLNLGYNITRNFAVELQTGFAYNSFASLDGVSLSDSGIDAEIWTVPVLVNGIYKYSFNDHWQAYGGLGAGVVFSTLDESTFLQDVSTTDSSFGYQAILGIKYRFNDRWEGGLGYSFLGTVDHHWTIYGVGMTTSPTYLHSILLSLTRKF